MIRLFSVLLLAFASNAFAVDYSWNSWLQIQRGTGYSSPSAACQSLLSTCDTTDGSTSKPSGLSSVIAIPGSNGTGYYCEFSFLDRGAYSGGQYQWDDNGRKSYYCGSGNVAKADRVGDSCPSPKVFNPATGACEAPVNPCTAKAGTITQWKKTWASFDAYTSMGERANQGGCAVTISSLQCGEHASGEYACWGSGTYTGDQDTTSGAVDNCVNPASCTPPEPTTSDSSQTCSPPTTNGSTTSYTCVTSSSAEQFAGSNCAYGEVNGTTGYHCTAPAYVPASDSQTRTDEVSETNNADGSKTTTTTSTTQKTYCEAGACNTTTTTTTTTKGTDANGNPTGETTTCTGDECKGPEDPNDGKMPGTVPGPSTAEAFPEIGGGNEVPTYAESSEAFYNRIGNAPIVAALGSIEVPSGGSCSIGSAALFGGSVSFDDFCDLAPQALAGLRYLFLAIWAWAAIRLFFTA